MITEAMIPPAAHRATAPAPAPTPAKAETTENEVAVMRRLISDYEARKADQNVNNPMRFVPRGANNLASLEVEANKLDVSIPQLIDMLREIHHHAKACAARGQAREATCAIPVIVRFRRELMAVLHSVAAEKFPLGRNLGEMIEAIRRSKK